MNRFGLAAFLLLAATPAFATDIDERAERERISRERAAAQSRYDADEAACRGRFLVTRCVEDAKARRRDVLERLRHEELVLDDDARRRRAAARLQSIEARQREIAERPPAPAQPAPVIREASQRPSIEALPDAPASGAAGHRADDAAKAARRAEAAERQRRQAAEDRARIAEREADRAARGRAAQPLPPRPPIPRD